MESVEQLEVFSSRSARLRYRVPISVIRELHFEGSRYSEEFDVGGCRWRFHIQEREADERYLALHLQSCSSAVIQCHFKLTAVCMRDPLLSKSKTFQCTFKKVGSAWGLHQFIPLRTLLDPEGGFVYSVSSTGTRCVDFEVMLQVGEKQMGRGGAGSVAPDRSYGGRSMSAPRPAAAAIGGGGGAGRGPAISGGYSRQPSLPPPRPGRSPVHTGLVHTEQSMDRRGTSVAGSVRASGRGGFVGSSEGALVEVTPSATPRAALAYPFEHLESLCDMTFDVQGVRVKAHRCVIGSRMRPLLPDQMLPLQVGCIVAIAVPLDVFTTFLRFVYTEDYPENGVLPAESLLDLYLIASVCEFYDLCNVCLQFVRPLLTPENILPIVLTRYNAADEVLTAMYLHVLLDYYDALIQDKQFEEIPGHLFRRLSLILANREFVPAVPIPQTKCTLGKQLAWLAESGEYSDMDWVVGPQQYTVRAHRFILASRSIAFSQAFNPRSAVPIGSFTGPEFDFSLRSWQKLLTGMYRRYLDTHRDFSAEDIAIVFKLHGVLGMDGHLKREADEAFSNANALRLLIYSVKHQIPELHERAVSYVARNFNEMARNDPQVWDLISDLPQSAVLSLFRTVTEHNQ